MNDPTASHLADAPEIDFIESVSSVVTDVIELAQRLPLPAGEAEPAAKFLDRLSEELAESAAAFRALPGRPREEQGYTYAAQAAITTAARDEHDFAGWLAAVLCHAAAKLGSSAALVAGRPGSWEAKAVMRLVQGTAGYADEYLSHYRDGAPQ